MLMFDAQQIKAIREALGMTQTEFAAALGTSFHAVYGWEHDRRHPKYETMRKINDLAKKHGVKIPVPA